MEERAQAQNSCNKHQRRCEIEQKLESAPAGCIREEPPMCLKRMDDDDEPPSPPMSPLPCEESVMAPMLRAFGATHTKEIKKKVKQLKKEDKAAAEEEGEEEEKDSQEGYYRRAAMSCFGEYTRDHLPR
jgi:hypothetical protein